MPASPALGMLDRGKKRRRRNLNGGSGGSGGSGGGSGGGGGGPLILISLSLPLARRPRAGGWGRPDCEHSKGGRRRLQLDYKVSSSVVSVQKSFH